MELYTLQVDVDGQRLTLTNEEELFSGDKGIDFIEFTFNDDKWSAMTTIYCKMYRFGEEPYKVELVENKAQIEAGVMQTKGYIYFGLFGTDGEVIQTSSIAKYNLPQGIASEGDLQPPSDIYEQWLEDLDAYQTAVSDLASIESRLTTAETTVANLEPRVATVETAVSNMEDTVDGLVSDVSGTRTTVDGLQTDVTNLQTSVSALESAVPTLQRDVSALQTGVTNLESRLTAISTSVGSLEDRLTTVQTSLTDLEDGLTDAEGRLTTIGNQITDAQTDIEEIETAIQQDNIVTDVTGGGVSFVNNHVADLSFMTVTDTATGSIATFPDGSGIDAVATEIEIEPKQAGSGTPSPDNVRAISGWSSVNCSNAQRNLFRGVYGELFPLHFEKGTVITVSANNNTSVRTQIYFYDENKEQVDYFTLNVDAGNGRYYRTFTVSQYTTQKAPYYFKFTNRECTDMMIELGDTLTAYESPINTQIPLGQTVYGGTLYPEEGRGVITMGMVTLDGVTPRQRFTGAWGSTSNGYAVYWNQDIPRTSKAISDKFFFSGNGYDFMPLGSFIGGSGAITTWSFILPSSVTSLSEANAWLAENPTTICYKLATPIEFTFPSVSIPTLNGTNNIWADSGDISLEYIADIKKYIEKVIS